MTAVAVASCSEKNVDLVQYEEKEELVTFSVSVPLADTKSVGLPDERNINTLQVFVFNRYGVYETYSYSSNNTVTLTCTAGEKRIVAMVNANTEEDVIDYDDLAARSLYLRDTGKGDLVMLGDSILTVTGKQPISIDVRHLSSKIILESVSLEFQNEHLQELPFAVKSVFLTNVAGDRKYIADSTPSVWFHQNGYDKNNTLPFLYDQVSNGHIVSGGDPYGTEHYFYCYSNETNNKTRLVIEAEIDGQRYYYPIVLDKVLPNNQYSYNVVLTRLGIDSPDGSLDKETYSVTVSMKDWQKNSSVVEI